MELVLCAWMTSDGTAFEIFLQNFQRTVFYEDQYIIQVIKRGCYLVYIVSVFVYLDGCTPQSSMG